MKNSIDITDFTFNFLGRGMYRVSYKSPVTGKIYENITTNMPLIDATKNADKPKNRDLNQLKRICKS